MSPHGSVILQFSGNKSPEKAANIAHKRRLTFQRNTQRYIPEDRTLHNHR
jgi:hypothetical protein